MCFCESKSTENFINWHLIPQQNRNSKSILLFCNYSIWRTHLCKAHRHTDLVKCVSSSHNGVTFANVLDRGTMIVIRFHFGILHINTAAGIKHAIAITEKYTHTQCTVLFVWFVWLCVVFFFTLLNVRTKRAIRWHSSAIAREQSNDEKSRRKHRKLIFLFYHLTMLIAWYEMRKRVDYLLNQ